MSLPALRRVAFVHASRAAVDPVTHYYAAEAPEFECTNLLDDGVMRALAAGDAERTQRRLREMIATARDEYAAEVAMLTCSALSPNAMRELRESAGIPLLKIDEPMARKSVSLGSRIGVLSTFPATAGTTRELIEEAARAAGRTVEIVGVLEERALQALLAGSEEEHDRLFLEAAAKLAGQPGLDAIVLAQVSMARLASKAAVGVAVPVLNSLDTSLAAVRSLLAGQ